MSEALSVTEVVRHFTDYVNRVSYRRESFVLLRGGKPVAELRPVPRARRLSDLSGLLATAPHLEDPASFSQDLEAARREVGNEEWVDPWES
jgi:antitoxin (DNA-binding transcriptional repressor) of toxin-antitoxin stability system